MTANPSIERIHARETPFPSGNDEMLGMTSAASTNSRFIGCYEASFEKWGGGGPLAGRHRIEVRVAGGGELEFVLHDGSETFTIPVRSSTAEELKMLGRQGVRAVEGLSAEPSEFQRNQLNPEAPPLVGFVLMARLVDDQGASELVAIMPFTAGVLTQVACR